MKSSKQPYANGSVITFHIVLRCTLLSHQWSSGVACYLGRTCKEKKGSLRLGRRPLSFEVIAAVQPASHRQPSDMNPAGE